MFFEQVEECEADVILSNLEKETTAVPGDDGSTKRKTSTRSTTQSKKKKDTPEQLTTLLKNTPVTKLQNFCEKKMNKDILTDSNSLIGLCEIIQNNSDGNFHPAVLLIIWAVHCPTYLETLYHPMKWTSIIIQNWWTTLHIMEATEMTAMLTYLRRNLKTPYTNMPVQYIVNLSAEYTNTSVPLLCQMDLMEFIEQSKNLKTLLTNTHLSTGTSSQVTEIISTCPTSAQIQTSLVGANGFNDQQHGQRMENVDFGELLGQASSNQSITPTYLDTYLKPLDSSTELVASQKMSDYVIDINIYRFVLKQYLLKQRFIQLNEQNYYLNYICPLSKKRVTTKPLKYMSTALLYHTPMLCAVQDVLNTDYNQAFTVFRNLCSGSIEFLEIFDTFDFINVTKFNEYIYHDKRCQKCTFVHSAVTTNTEFEVRKQLKNTYKLLTSFQLDYIINLCRINTYLSKS